MNNATLNIEQYTMKDLYDVFDMSTTDTYTRDYVTKKYNTLVTNIIDNSSDCMEGEGDPWIRMSDELIEIVTELRNYMFENIYLPVSNSSAAISSMRIIEILFDYLMNNSDLIPDYLLEVSEGNLEKSVIDYITGMTDDFALRFAETLDPSLASDVFEGRL